VCNTDVIFSYESTFGCTSGFLNTALFPSLVVESNDIPTATVSSVITGYGAVNAFSVQIRYQSTDFQSSQTVSYLSRRLARVSLLT
jgi:hypothetical protein